jgi:acyl-CoA thioesterase
VPGTFSEDVVVRRIGDGRYRATVDHSWDVATLPQGGVVAAFGLRASAAEVEQPTSALKTCTTVFAGPVEAGELEVDVNVLRRGRSAAQVVSTVRNAGAENGATTVAVFGSARRGPSFVDVTPPDVPPPNECRSYRDALPRGVEPMTPRPIWLRMEGRAALGHAPWEEYEPTSSDVATWIKFDEPPRMDDGSLDPLAVVTLVDRMPGAVAEREGWQRNQWFAPSVDLTVHLFRPATTEWLLAHDRARWADGGWASAESTLWDEGGQLVAYATQLMVFAYG